MTPLKRIQSLLVERRFERAWKQAGKSPARDVLRLAVLRDWSRQIHAQTSRLLALGKGEHAAANQKLEIWIDDLARKNWQHLEWRQLQDRPELPVTDRESQLAPDTDPDWASRLNRHDRLWERQIWLESQRARWTGFELRAKVPIRRVESWNEALAQALWPRGVVLFTEAGTPPLEGDSWNGRWFAVSEPQALSRKTPLIVRGIEVQIIPGMLKGMAS